jgi:hypothetical protein
MSMDTAERLPFHNPVRTAMAFPATATVQPRLPPPAKYTRDSIRHFLRQLGITEPIVIHEQDYERFLEEKGIKELGRGGEATVYFLRGHVVKVAQPDSVPAVLRETAHMLLLNRIASGAAAVGERTRVDYPTLLWVYALSDGSVSIGMKPFDSQGTGATGATLYEHLVAGPALERLRTLDSIRHIGRSLVYLHRSGIIHHDLKPANIYIPSDPRQPPVIFDLAQALWRQPSWGRDWLNHDYNNIYWYNGTYRYMHYQRRVAHLAALAKVSKQEPTASQAAAFNRYRPSFYDDVFAFARILYDMVHSMNTWLSAHDRAALRKFYRHLMSLKQETVRVSPKKSSAILDRIRKVMGASSPPVEHVDPHEPPAISMEDVQPALEKVLSGLLQAPPE